MPKENTTVENVLSTIGAIMWTVQIIPQIVKSYRAKSTMGLSAGLMAVWAFASYPFSSYIVAQDLAIALQVQPHAFGFLCGVSWMQCLYYGKGYSKLKTLMVFLLFLVGWAGFETGSVYGLKAATRKGIEAPTLVYGYVTAVMLAAALLPQYWEIYKLKEVVGISLIFMAVDILGGVFSFSSLFFREKLDIAAFVSYLLVVVLDGIVVILAFTLNPITARRRQREQESANLDLENNTSGQSGAPITHGAEGGSVDEAALARRITSRSSVISETPQHFRWPEGELHRVTSPRRDREKRVSPSTSNSDASQNIAQAA